MEEFRLHYPLTHESIVLDAGAYHGDFIEWCRRKWGCMVYAFEPSKSYYTHVAQRFELDSLVRVFNWGLGEKTEILPLSIQGDSTTVFFEEATVVDRAEIRDVAEVFESLRLAHVDLFKINIEGGEYGLMRRMLETQLVQRVRFFQIQYHGIGAGPEGPAVARGRIRAELDVTHKEEWCVNGGQWESWALR